MRIDMHLHTARSFDCLIDPDRIVTAAMTAGLDRICVTDHNQIGAALALKSAHPDFIIVGEEVKTAEGVDIIGLYINELIPKGTPARDTCMRIREQGGLVYVPHPFARGKGGDGFILPIIEDLVDAVEGFNARLHDPTLNERAVAWAQERNLPLGAGSDAHTLMELGRGAVDVDPFEDTAEGFLAALRNGHIHGTTSSRMVHVASTYAKVHKVFVR
ncbi:MAG: PHP domain-containing protein [Longimicrobiales bacterium]